MAFAVLLIAAIRLDPLQPLGRLSDPSIRETSGIVKSRRYPDVFWILSDSGNPPVIHAIRRDGRVLASFRVAAPNVDWEDIAADDAGHLYLGDIGNNGGLLPLRAVYRIDEPDPGRPNAEALRVTLATYYQFPSKAGRFDAESLFVVGKDAFLIAKHRDGRVADLFALGLDPPAPLIAAGPAAADRAELPGFTEPATGAVALRARRHAASPVVSSNACTHLRPRRRPAA